MRRGMLSVFSASTLLGWCLAIGCSTEPTANGALTGATEARPGQTGECSAPGIECVTWGEPMRFDGIWINVIDGSDCFLPGRTAVPDAMADEDCMMLADESELLPSVDGEEARRAGFPLEWRIAKVELIGRRTVRPRPAPPPFASVYFGDALRRHEIWVERVIRFESLEEGKSDDERGRFGR